MEENLLFELYQGLMESIQYKMTGHAFNKIEQLVKLVTSIEITMMRKAAARKANDQKAKSKEKIQDTKVVEKQSHLIAAGEPTPKGWSKQTQYHFEHVQHKMFYLWEVRSYGK